MSLLLLTILTPLLLALMILSPHLRPWMRYCLPLAVVPALLLALKGDPEHLVLPFMLTGMELGLDPLRGVFLWLAVLVWLVAGAFASRYLGGDRYQHRFCFYWLLTLTGNLWLILAFDVPGFYSGFALMTFAAYGLVVHNASKEAQRAGRVYLWMAVLGEGLLVAGLFAAVSATDNYASSLHLLPAAIAESEQTLLISGLIFFGLGVKAGIAGLHLWLPLAHPVAPTPASAVLSGVMIKAGLLGWLLLLPLGEVNLPGAGLGVVVLGLVAALGGALIGVCQQSPKAVLAYSSISQMGLMTLAVGAALMDAQAAPALMGITALYALHHGLAKGTLFLGVSTLGRNPWWLLPLALPALALVGWPLSSGAAAKLALKDALPAALDTGWLLALLSLAAAGTTALMLRFFWTLRGQLRESGPRRPDPWLLACWLVGLACTGGLFWWLPLQELPALVYGLSPGKAVDLILPPLVAMVLAALGWGLLRQWLKWPALPPGDLLLPLTALMVWLSHQGHQSGRAVAVPGQRLMVRGRVLLDWLMLDRGRPERLEAWLRQQVAWIFLLLLCLMMLLALSSL
ncbi:MAG: NADH-ubiquinone oxidoreductase [Halomonadaceae bacterium]|nr:MAG: NADH-ubiquinone oxidoreductase [Halomonadaceae bacterium]